MARGWSYIGIDESNHGRHPEIFVASFSRNQNDGVVYSGEKLNKRRKH